MAWEKRSNSKFYYQSVRQGTKVRKVYWGRGPMARIVEAGDVLRQSDRQAALAERREIEAAQQLTKEAKTALRQFAAASLLAQGYHRPSRHAWRIWYAGRRALHRRPDH